MPIAPHGSWKSALTARRVTAGLLRFDHVVLDGDDLYWAEGRAAEGGRSVVVRRTRDGAISDVTPAGFNVRTRVHEYGGAAYTVDRGSVFFSNFADQRLYRQDAGSAPEALTAEGCFYADACVDRSRQRLLCVREDHTGAGEPVNTIAAVATDGGDERVLVEGADFYSDPILSPDGREFAWLQWNHPNMPWDGTELWLAAVNEDGTLGARVLVAGGDNESVFQPEWSPDGRLYFVSDRNGFWNLYRAGAAGAPSNAVPAGASSASSASGAARAASATGAAADARIEALHQMAADFGKAQWVFSARTYAFMDADRLAVTYTQDGRWRLAVLDVTPRSFTPLDLPIAPIESIRARGTELFFIGGSPTQPPSVVRLETAGSSKADVEIVRAASADRIDPAWISAADAINFDSDGRRVHAFYYAPKNPDFSAPAGDRPPLLVLSHGGPTASAIDVLDARIQFWTSRGFAVLDVNYGGSDGFGREYRDRLKERWGIVDVADCVNGARHLVEAGQVDPARLMIRGGSAGGYTTLAALTFHDVFRAGASHYGVSDIEVLARDTHKFESRYLDSLIGPYPAAREEYVRRSPIHFTDRLSCALILFQGLEDRVVPPNQSAMMAEAVRRKGLPVAYLTFAGEQHGFRRAETIVRCLEAELYFYGAVFGFPIADAVEPVDIANLPQANIGGPQLR